MLRLPVVSPCDVPWQDMTPAKDGRRCAACARDVVDFSVMTETRATAYVLLLGGSRLCGRVAYGADGAPLFRPPPPSPAAPIGPAAVRAAAAVAVLAAASGCAEVPPPPALMPVEPAKAVLAVAAPVLAVASSDLSAVDSDKDGIPDEVDACPYEPGTAHEDPYKNGCRTFVGIIVDTPEVYIVERIQFAKGQAGISKTSIAVLSEVAQVLKEHPELKKVLIAGHAASDEANAKSLSDKRAKAVMKALTASGVDAARLETAAHGADHPIKENITADGRDHNRRVQFQIIDSSPASP